MKDVQLNISNFVRSIGMHSFSRCSEFSENLDVDYAAILIDEYSFQYCTGFNGSLIINSSVKMLQAQTFEGCS